MYSLVYPCVPSSSYSSICTLSGSTSGGSFKYECCSTDNCNNQAYFTNNSENLSSSSLQSFALSSLTSAASASTSSSFPVYSNSITITNCELLYYYISVNKYIY